MFIVYKYTSPSGKHYVGLTNNPKRRKEEHKKKQASKRDTSKFANAIRKYGYKAFKYEEIATGLTIEQACEIEIYWIKTLDAVSNGYNVTPGGPGGANIKYTTEEIQQVVHLLKNTNKSYSEIKEITGVSSPMISQLKDGNRRCVEDCIGREKKFKKGEAVSTSKLTSEQVLEIKNELAKGTRRSTLQKRFNVSKNTIQNIAVGVTWSHIEADYKYDATKNVAVKLTREKVIAIRAELAAGASKQAMADKYSISIATVWQIFYRKSWKGAEPT
jgi:group I intron endonuclease